MLKVALLPGHPLYVNDQRVFLEHRREVAASPSRLAGLVGLARPVTDLQHALRLVIDLQRRVVDAEALVE